MNKFLLSLLLLCTASISSESVRASPLYYTFSGSVTSILERTPEGGVDANGVNPYHYASLGQSVHYVFEIDFAQPGLHTIFNGNTFPIPDIGLTFDYFYANFMPALSSPTLPQPIDINGNPILGGDLLMQYGEDADTPVRLAKLHANSKMNEFFIFLAGENIPLVREWQVGTAVNAQSRACYESSCLIWYDLFTADLTVTDISSTAPGTNLPEPTTLALLGTALIALIGCRRRTTKTALATLTNRCIG